MSGALGTERKCGLIRFGVWAGGCEDGGRRSKSRSAGGKAHFSNERGPRELGLACPV